MQTLGWPRRGHGSAGAGGGASGGCGGDAGAGGGGAGRGVSPHGQLWLGHQALHMPVFLSVARFRFVVIPPFSVFPVLLSRVGPRAQRTVRSRCGYWQDSKVRTTLLSAGEKKGRGLLRMRWAPALENRVAASGACSAAVYF